MIPLAGRRIQDLLAELITAKQIEVANPGGEFDRLECLADRGCFFGFYKEEFSKVVFAFNTYRITFFIGFV